MDDRETMIRVSGVSKRFRKFVTRGQYTTLKTSLVQRLFRRERRPERFLTVLENVDLEVPRGQAVGVIGRNGSGKSTLLKLIAGILKADTGKIEVRGRVSPLIELGAGFHPEFSGRENVYLNGIVLGLSRAEIDERFDTIVDFADLRDFIDDPVRTYSSGMYMRLGFSIAVHAAPDVLLIDEILAVGDQSFARKCQEWMAGFLDRGGTFLLVTHDLGAVGRWCSEALWLDAGRVRMRGAARDVIASYVDAIDHEAGAAFAGDGSPSAGNLIREVRVHDRSGAVVDRVSHGETIAVEVDHDVSRTPAGASVEIRIRRVDGVSCVVLDTADEGIAMSSSSGLLRCRFPRLPLLSGTYVVDVSVHDADRHLLDHRVGAATFSLEGGAAGPGVFRPEHEWELA